MSATSAIYHVDNDHLRCINISGKWQMQEFGGGKGTRVASPWHNVGLLHDEPLHDEPLIPVNKRRGSQ